MLSFLYYAYIFKETSSTLIDGTHVFYQKGSLLEVSLRPPEESEMQAP